MGRKFIWAALALAGMAGAGVAPASLFSPAYARTEAAAAHERLLPLEGGRNFRDLGGYATADGRHVKWGMLYRSGSMHGLTPKDYAYLEKLGIRVVCDFRSSGERKVEPAAWPVAGAPRVLADDYDMQSFMPRGDMNNLNYDQARDRLSGMYPVILDKFNSQYRRMFSELLAGHAPLAFNCSAGKDRTGIAAALLLTALGVPRQTVIADYLATNQYLKPAQLTGNASLAPADNDWSKMPNSVMKAFLAADQSYLEAALAVVDKHAGGADGYLRDELGLSAADLKKLRGIYMR